MQASESIQSADPAVISAMPVGSTNVESPGTLRYSRDQLLSICHATNDSNPQRPDVSALFVPGWNPGHTNGAAPRGWGSKTGDSHAAPQEPDICWDAPGSTRAVGLQEMNPQEKELFASDVNSSIKPPAQNKDGNHPGGGANGRKTSLSHGTPNNFGLASPSASSRPGTRRRETTDTNPYSGSGGGLVSPSSSSSATRPPRDEQSFWFGRKNVDPKDSTFEEPEEDMAMRDAATKPSLFGGLMRNNTTPAASALGGTSPWPASTANALPGIGSFGNFALPGSTIGEKRPGNPRGESRLAHLIPKESSDSVATKSNEDASRPWRPRQRTDTDPFGEDGLSGSAVLGGAQDTSPPLHTSTFDTPMKGSTADFGMASLNLGGHPDHGQAPLSPSETNPYRSPPGERGERGENEDAGERQHVSGGISDQASGYGGGVPRAFAHAAFDGSDRSQTSSVGAKTYPPLSNLTGWPSSGTPDRERAPFSGFGGSLFDLQSPSLGNLGGVFAPAGTTGFGGSGSFGRASKLGSLFPPAMQAQMQSQDNESLSDSIPDLRQPNPLGAIGRNAPGDHVRETDSPMRAGRGVFADMFAQAESSRTPASTETLHGAISPAPHGQAFPGTSSTPSYSANLASDPPSVQSRTMVMPDRMRWVYLDPQGQQQGPFTGLEMNDWYKANFFTPDLRVKKLEDSEFEPLGQLIRRIGNSREPFLVPQIGIPHGPPSQTGPFSNSGGVIQPPLVNAFPSFGRTLTAEEQNNLERRKQEEQYLMARHREFYATQGRVPMPGVPGLHHHSSAHSLQSQPSFGSITSPITMPPQPPVGAIGMTASFFDTPATHQTEGNSGQGLEMFREDELARLSGPERQMLAGLHSAGATGGNLPPQSIGAPTSEAGVRSQLPGSSDLVEDAEGFRGRLQEFEKLRAQHDAEMMERQASPFHGITNEQAPAQTSPPTLSSEPDSSPKESPSVEIARRHAEEEQFALTKQYQQAQAAAAAAKISGLPMPFPPPPSATPLPAPAPQRIKSNLPEQYATISRSGTPDITPSSAATQPPPLAPWAKDGGVESHKGPSLKEIQQAEALKAAKEEEAAALARRVALEQEAAREREKVAAAAPGLPTTSTWGTASPVTPGATSSPWAKPGPGKAPASGPVVQAQSADKKKTLADIQREEESRKQRARETAGQAGQAGQASGTGKRYADLASKPNATPILNQAPGGNTSGWATVGAGGKVKAPTAPASQPRPTSSAAVKPVAAAVAAAPARPAVKPANSTAGAARTEAVEEFTKWLHGQLAKGITGITDIEAFANTLMGFPLVGEIISDAIYANSKTMDGRHFAEEFIRRKKLADRGIVEKQSTKSPSVDTQSTTTGGWNEVAKKSSHKDSTTDTNSIQGAFKVVPGRKKGKK